ncbi:MAG: ROK family glucokinase [Candidatus Izemoplasmataceae bacterium]
MERYIYGIDVGGTTIKIGLFSLKGTLMKKWAIDTDLRDSGKNILKNIAEAIKNESISMDEIEGFGFGVPGPVKDDIVIEAVNLGWVNLDLKREFLRYFDQPLTIKVYNDANIAALGEQAFGAGKNVDNMVLFTLGTGVGGGVIEQGKIIEGAHGAGGEIGHMYIGDYDLRCGCGNLGCLETLASATGVKKLASYFIEATHLNTKLRTETSFSAKYVFELAKNGDELALKVVDEVANALAKACQIISVITNPDCFVFGGGVSLAGEFLLHKIEQKFKAIAFNPVKDKTAFYLAELGNDAGIYGCYQAVRTND